MIAVPSDDCEKKVLPICHKYFWISTVNISTNRIFMISDLKFRRVGYSSLVISLQINSRFAVTSSENIEIFPSEGLISPLLSPVPIT